MKIGSKIKEMRTRLNLTQEELANRLELTKGYISQLENDLTEPSISTLEDIVLALGTNLSDFFKEEENEQIIFKKDDYFVKNNEGFDITWLITSAQKNQMEPILVKIHPHSKTDIDYPHEGEEFGLVLAGEIVLKLGTESYAIKKGESFYFSSTKEHYLQNTKDQVAKIVWVSTPPNF